MLAQWVKVQHFIATGSDTTEVLRDIELYQNALSAEQAKEADLKEVKEGKDDDTSAVMDTKEVCRQFFYPCSSFSLLPGRPNKYIIQHFEPIFRLRIEQ